MKEIKIEEELQRETGVEEEEKVEKPKLIIKGQVVGGFIGSKLEMDWDLPEGITKEMVYTIPVALGHEWRLRYKYIDDPEIREILVEDEEKWCLGDRKKRCKGKPE